MPCSSNLLQSLDLGEWNQVASVIILNNDMLRNAVKGAEEDMKQILSVENTKSYADPYSPVGTAFRFNRPKRQATMIANTSLLLQLTSIRLMDNYIDR